MDYKSYTYKDCLYTIINYQQEIIKRYEEYIEKNIHQSIKKVTKEDFDVEALTRLEWQRITIPQVDLMMVCDPSVMREYDLIKSEFPLFPLHLIEQFVEEKLSK